MKNSYENELLLTLGAICILLLMLVIFIILLAGLFKKRQTEYLQEKTNLQVQYQQEILQAQIEIQNQTLQQIGRELHDNIGQLLSVMSIKLDVLEEDTNELETKNQIIETAQILHRTISEIRHLSKSLDGDFVKDFGLAESLSHELQRIRSTGKYQTEIQIKGEPYRLDEKKEIVLFRVAQEILNNILKHAAAKSIQLTLHYDPNQFSLTIVDNGKGFDYEAVLSREMSASGSGLRNIQRRMELLGGSYKIDSTFGKGTEIHLDLPVSAKIP